MKASLEELKKYGLEMKNLQLFRTALTHSSFVHEHPNQESNERLEYLGDAVLDLLVGEILFQKFPKWPEGTLSRVRASLVRESVLAEVAATLQLGKFLRMGRGEEQSGGRQKASILADTFEAVLGAIYLDSGLEESRQFIESVMSGWLKKAKDYEKKLPDAKTRLQEMLQVNGAVEIRYQTERVGGSSDHPHFLMGLWVNGKKKSEGTGKSKKEAEQAAAARALEELEKSDA